MHQNRSILGIDIGSVSLSVVEISPAGEILHSFYRTHGGYTADTLKKALGQVPLNRVGAIAVTNSTPAIIATTTRYDGRLAIIRAAGQFYPAMGAILQVGGEKFGLIRFDAQGQYRGFKTNTSCAAGTGSFLDQQAQRLDLPDSGALSECALNNRSDVPRIASRCAVFAKTDLIHAQQEGHSLEAICDGLCYGLAKNICDTLFAGEPPLDPVIFAGGVARNQAVAAHIRRLTRNRIEVHPLAHLFGALGAALSLVDERSSYPPLKVSSVDDLLLNTVDAKTYHYAPMALTLSDFPDFEAHEQYLFKDDTLPHCHTVEVDLYLSPATDASVQPAYLGIDIGSTSTKAVLLTPDEETLAGFYTRTSGRPLTAMQSILAAVDDLQTRQQRPFAVIGAGTTGSGRKFIGKAVGADLVIDEITAHARAAHALNPDVDTIIEIGGQDAKFTTLEKGIVTFAVMNTVCAAGTGSFIEEQARQLGCRLSDFSARTRGQRAPMASDRCTVFMERDLYHYLSQGYTVDEVLTAVLHSVRENYLTKVAVPARIGRSVTFQGATAKNQALVAAFEQRLGQPVHVSRFCHLTGALGVALNLADAKMQTTHFRGVHIYRQAIPLTSEMCDLCANHCKITVMNINHQKVAYGFLCGREYDTRKRGASNPSGFDLQRARRAAFAGQPAAAPPAGKTIGIPAALHLYEDVALWQHFFNQLGVPTITSSKYQEAVREGKQAAGAEFCAPMAALHGHVAYLLSRADYVFMPYYLETRPQSKDIRRQYCYYTQYAAPLASHAGDEQKRNRFLMPLVHYLYNPFYAKAQLYRMLKSFLPNPPGFATVSSAYDQAVAFKQAALKKLKKTYITHTRNTDNIHAVLLGRPYTVLPASMNKGIPHILAALGIKTFFQDMLAGAPHTLKAAPPLLQQLHWHYAAEILTAAEVTAQTPGAYPVLVTSFKCSPDAFAVDYFKKVMRTYDKPYLVLQVDDHDAAGGYETRIEAAVRVFRNHHGARTSKAPETPEPNAPALIPIPKKRLFEKTLLMPNWDDLTLPLLVAALRKEGIDARILEDTPAGIQKSLRHNTGQCIPLNIIAQDVIDYIHKYDLDPSRTALWMMSCSIACNLHLYPLHIRDALDAYGKGMERAGIYLGPISMQELSLKLPINVYFAFMFGGYLRRMGCRVRPYEKIPGRTDQVIAESMTHLVAAFEGRQTREAALEKVIRLFEGIERSTPEASRPKVAIFGDFYTRDNDLINQDLIAFIEANGGEAITMPYSEYMKMVTKPYLRKWLIEGQYLTVLTTKLFTLGLKQQESAYFRAFARILKEPEPTYPEPAESILAQYNLRLEHAGESMDNVLKVHYLTLHHPDIALLAQTSPAFCCPALITEAMARRIEARTGVPMVSITYDGTGGNKNEVLVPYLKFAQSSDGRKHRAMANRGSMP